MAGHEFNIDLDLVHIIEYGIDIHLDLENDLYQDFILHLYIEIKLIFDLIIDPALAHYLHSEFGKDPYPGPNPHHFLLP